MSSAVIQIFLRAVDVADRQWPKVSDRADAFSFRFVSLAILAKIVADLLAFAQCAALINRRT
jgi:hypothetical protein